MSVAETGAQRNNRQGRYADIANLIYRVRRLCPRLAALGIPTLHLRHPLLTDQLQLLETLAAEEGSDGSTPMGDAAEGGRILSFAVIVKQWLWCVLFACRETLWLLVLKGSFRSSLERLTREPATVLLKTWCFGPASVDGAGDFYYGTLPQQLATRGISSLLLCGDTRGKMDRTFMQAVLQRDQIRSVPEQLLVPIWAPAVVVCRQLTTALALRRLARQTLDHRLAKVCAVASRWSLQPITLRNLLHFYIARAAVKRWHSQVFVAFYEGQPWEQPAWHGAKAANPQCATVGYQHTIVMPHSQSLLSPHRDSWERSAPDVVLCVGQVTRRMLEEGHTPLGTRLVTFGTFRRPSDDPVRLPHPTCRTVLVLPEGNLIEARLLFNFAMRVARLTTDHRFIFRCHPMLPFSEVRSHLHDNPDRFPRIELSDRDPIAADFARSSILLYRGSSAVLYAVLHGIKPVYLHDDTHPDIDPLFEVTGWRDVVSSPQDMHAILQGYAAERNPQLTEEWSGVVEYVKTYAMPVDEASIDRFLDAVGGFHGVSRRHSQQRASTQETHRAPCGDAVVASRVTPQNRPRVYPWGSTTG